MKTLTCSLLLFLITNTLLAQNQRYIATQKALDDIEFMIKTIEEVHYNPYFKVSQKDFQKSKTALLSTFDPDSITLKRFLATGMKLVAQMSGGHTAMDWQNPHIIPELAASQFLPFTGKITKNNTFIVTQSATHDIKVGAEITHINGQSMVALYNECLSYLGGIESFKIASCETALPLYSFFTEMVTAPYTFKVSHSETTIQSEGINLNELIPFLTPNQGLENYTFTILENNIGLITYNNCEDYDAFDIFLKTTFEQIKDQNISQLIIDIRENTGGNSELNDLLLAYITTTPYQQLSGRYWKVSNLAKSAYRNNDIYAENFGETFMNNYYAAEDQSVIKDLEGTLLTPEKPKNYFTGTTCVLIGASTFSSANLLADAVKTYRLSTLIGTSTGENTNDFGEQISFTLPNSANYIFVSSTYDIGANGNPDVFEPVHPDFIAEEDALTYAIDWIKKADKK